MTPRGRVTSSVPAPEGAAVDEATDNTFGNYSARPILASDNQEAGRRLGQFYKTYRVADDVDRFHVRITP